MTYFVTFRLPVFEARLLKKHYPGYLKYYIPGSDAQNIELTKIDIKTTPRDIEFTFHYIRKRFFGLLVTRPQKKVTINHTYCYNPHEVGVQLRGESIRDFFLRVTPNRIYGYDSGKIYYNDHGYRRGTWVDPVFQF